MTHFHFSFQTPDEASALAKEIASLPVLSGHAYMELGLNEIFFNAIEHGNLGISYEKKRQLKEEGLWDKTFYNLLTSPAHQHKKVNVDLDITPFLITIDIEDEGEGFNWQAIENIPSSDVHHGRGLFIAKKLSFDKIEFLGKGNQIRCFIYKYSPQKET